MGWLPPSEGLRIYTPRIRFPNDIADWFPRCDFIGELIKPIPGDTSNHQNLALSILGHSIYSYALVGHGDEAPGGGSTINRLGVLAE